jgi:hypothetical protein
MNSPEVRFFNLDYGAPNIHFASDPVVCCKCKATIPALTDFYYKRDKTHTSPHGVRWLPKCATCKRSKLPFYQRFYEERRKRAEADCAEAMRKRAEADCSETIN